MSTTGESASVSYEKGSIKITKEELILMWYYFPFGQEARFKLPLQTTELREIMCAKFQTKIWGMGLSWVWWHFDGCHFRDGRRAFVVNSGCIASGFTPPEEDWERVRSLILQQD